MIEPELLKYFDSLEGLNIVEIGAGRVSTDHLSAKNNLTSIECDERWINLFPNVNYIHAPIVDGWYDLGDRKFKCDILFIDGPLGTGNRYGIIHNFNLFEAGKIIIHDTSRPAERMLAKAIAHIYNRAIMFYENWAVLW